MVSHPLCLSLTHPLRMCLRAPPARGPWLAAPSWPPPYCLPGSPSPLPTPQGATAGITLLPASLDAGVHLSSCLLSKY